MAEAEVDGPPVGLPGRPSQASDTPDPPDVALEVPEAADAAAGADGSPGGYTPGRSSRTITERSVLIKNAEKHMAETACTELDDNGELQLDENGEPKWMPLSKGSFGHLGVGVKLYFDFIFQTGILLFVLQIFSMPSLVAFVLGGMVQDNNPVNLYTGKASVANFGNCPEIGCSSTEELNNRCAFGPQTRKFWGNDYEDCVRASELSPYLGILDAVGVLVFVLFSVYFSRRWIPKVVEKVDKKHTTPSDYTIMVRECPRVLGTSKDGEHHARYEATVKEHFTEVLKSLKKDPVDDPEAVAEVVLVRDYEGMIKQFMEYGTHLEEKADAEILLDQARQQGIEAKQKKYEKTINSYKKRVDKVREALAHQAELEDKHREVVMLFVTFKMEEYRDKVLDEYRFANYSLFRLCQSERLQLDGHRIHVTKACEPNDLYWENLDYSKWRRLARKIFIAFLTLVVLIACSLAIVSLKGIGGVSSAAPPSRTAWVLTPQHSDTAGEVAECFKLCDADFYAEARCLPTGGSSGGWPATRLFTHANDTSLGGSTLETYFGSNCESPILSPACYGETDIHKNWIGFEFDTARTIECTRLLQGQMTASSGGASGVVDVLRVYACPSPPDADNRSTWGPDECERMEAVYPAIYVDDATNTANSGSMRLTLDTQCDLQAADEDMIHFDVAARAKASAQAKEADGEPDAVMNDYTYTCYCKQQLASQGPAFITPKYNTPSKELCKTWSSETSLSYGRLAGTILAVLILNQVLLVIYTFFIDWERLMTVSEVAKSQLGKLFAAQFINTGLLALLVNAKIHSLPDILSFIRILSLGEGNYYDLNAQWFTAVGSSVLITIIMQVFSTTMPPLVISYIVTPLQIRYMARGKVTQETMNRAYQLPDWNLALRLAQSMNVIFCVVMFSSGMPIMYTVGWLYCFVAYWLDKISLLRGSKRPPNYSQEVMVICMHFLPAAAFLHASLAVWTFGSQLLFPSNWNEYLLPLGETLFGISRERSIEVIEAYSVSAIADREALYWEYILARALDMSRDGAAMLMVVFLAFCAFYIITYLYEWGLKPFVDPVLFIIRETCCGSCKCCGGREVEHNPPEWSEAQKVIARNGMPTSYHMEAHKRYKGAADAIKASVVHAEEERQKKEGFGVSPDTAEKKPAAAAAAEEEEVGPPNL